MPITLSNLVGTLDELQAALTGADVSDITINSTISILEDIVLDFNGKTVKIAENFSRDSVFILSKPNISLTFKSSNGSGGIVPVKLNQSGGLVFNDTRNSTVTFDEGFEADYSEFKNFNLIRDAFDVFGPCPVNVTLNFSGANIKIYRQIYAHNVNISGGSIYYTGEDAAIVIAENGVLNISNGAVKSVNEKRFCIGISGGAEANIFGGTFTAKNMCLWLQNGAKGKISGGTFEGICAIGIADSASEIIGEVTDATFNVKYEYALRNNACVKINGVTYTNTDTNWSSLKQKFSDADKNKIDSVSIRHGAVEVKDRFGVHTLNASEEYSYNEIYNDKYFYSEDFDEIIIYWQAHLFKNYGLRYRAEILSSLYFGLQTDKLILLVGNPGTGKTTLVKYLAKSFDFEDAAIIPVQPNWTDKGDLLGYYNPLEKSYMATEFLEALIKFSRLAENQPDKLFIICLDEMNLAHIEYYFAEFLSALQTDRKITLYGESIRENICRELKAGGFDLNSDVEFDEKTVMKMQVSERQYYLELWRMYDMVKKFPATLTIPPNVKFFGTLNQDETTLDISPKVIDRSYIIRLEMFKENLNCDGDFERSLQYLPLESYQQKYPADIDVDAFNNTMDAVAPTSYRLIAQVLQNPNFDTWQKIIGDNQLEDFIISSYILPKIRFDEDAYKKKIYALKNLCEGHKLSEKILNEIDTGSEADFWRR